MSADQLPRRCPECNSLVVDRRSPNCTHCRAELPAAWVMTKAQAAKVTKMDTQAKAFFKQEMQVLDPLSNPNVPPVVRFLDQNVSGLTGL